MNGFNPTNFSDSYNPTQDLVMANRVRAKQKSRQVLFDSNFGGAVTKMFGKNKGDKLVADAQGSAQSTLNRAGGVMGVLDFAGGMGRIGASPGGFGAFFDKPPAFNYEGLKGGFAANPVTAPPPVPGLP